MDQEGMEEREIMESTKNLTAMGRLRAEGMMEGVEANYKVVPGIRGLLVVVLADKRCGLFSPSLSVI